MSKLDVPYAKIAEELGISTATVSRAIKHPDLVKRSTLKKIYKAVEELGGTIPESLTPISSGVRILAIIPVFSNPFYTDIVQGIQDSANQHGCELIIINQTLSSYNVKSILDLIAQSNVAGVVLMQKVDESVLQQLNARTNVIQCSEFNANADIPYITIDNIAASKKMMKYILSTQKKRIALIDSDPSRYTYAKLRLQGYQESLEEAGIEYDPSLVIIVPDGKFSDTVSAVSSMLERGNVPEAIFCVSDIMAAATLRACTLEGYRVPQDIVVTGFDNIDISVMTTPNITTISQPKRDMGFMACSHLLSMVNSHTTKEAQKFILDTELIIRESSTN